MPLIACSWRKMNLFADILSIVFIKAYSIYVFWETFRKISYFQIAFITRYSFSSLSASAYSHNFQKYVRYIEIEQLKTFISRE